MAPIPPVESCRSQLLTIMADRLHKTSRGLLPVYETPEHGRVIVCMARPTPLWMKRVASEFTPSRTLYVWPDEDAFQACVIDGGNDHKPSPDDLERTAAVLCREGHVADGAEVILRTETTIAKVVARPDEFTTVNPSETVYDAAALEAQIREQNTTSMERLIKTLRSKTGVIPFVGAGASGPFGYPLWGEFLEGAATTEEDRVAVAALVKRGEFEQAAQHLVNSNKENFYNCVRTAFTKPPDLMKVAESALIRLPLLAPGPVITTNFDPVLENVFKLENKPFTADNLVLGRNDPDRVVTALQEDSSTLIKLHGDADAPDSLTFTAVEYEMSYGNSERSGALAQLASVLYTNRPLLFLGCSLETDRTLRSLKKVHDGNPFLRHYAILAASYRSTKLSGRVKELADAGLIPLWFAPGEFTQICELLDELVDLMARDRLRHPRLDPKKAKPAAPLALLQRVEGVAPELADEQIEGPVEALLSGRLAFFLGAAVHANKMRGREFYDEICRRAFVPRPSRDRADAAQYVVDTIGRAKLSRIVEEIVSENYTKPSEVHLLLAGLPRTLRERPQATVEPLMILTTNYDSVLESAFDAVGEPYHLFLYNHDGFHAGCFLHRLPNGEEYVIRKPTAVRRLGGNDSVIVKMNGGVDPQGEWRGSFVVASRDFKVLSNRLPQAIPHILWDRLKARSLMFWGHGLAESDVDVLTHQLKQERSVPISWAVQLEVVDAEYWRNGAGIEIIEADLGTYVERFSSTLATRLQST